MSHTLPSSTMIEIHRGRTSEHENVDLPSLLPNQTEPTVSQVWGPYYVQYAPFRAKISPIHAVGVPLIIQGRVFGLDTRRPIPFASIDIWQASPDAEYDYHEVNPNIEYQYKQELNTHGRSTNYDYRARLITDEQGRYEYETVKPPPYFYPVYGTWRCPHIHYYVQAPGYKPLVTQLYFKNEPKNDTDRHIRESITIELTSVEYKRSDSSIFTYYKGEFDIILEPVPAGDD